MKQLKSNLKLVASLGLLLILFILIIAPLFSIFIQTIVVDGQVTLDQVITTLAERKNLQMIINSLLLGFFTVIMTSLIALPLAYLFTKTSMAKYQFFDTIFMMPFMTPPFIASMGWILFMQRRGLLQRFIPALDQSDEFFFTITGLVIVMSFHNFPFMYTMMKNAILNIPASLEEGAAVFGANFWRRIRKVFIPLITGNYAIAALLVFVKVISEYGTPATLGKRIGFNVFTTEIHRYATVAPISFGKSASLASILVTICLGLWMIQTYVTNQRTYNLISGKGSRSKLIQLKPWQQVLAWGYILAIITGATIIPMFSVFATSIIKLRGYGFRFDNLTFKHYYQMFTANDKTVAAILNSFLLAFVAATVCALLGTLIVLTIRNLKGKLAKGMEAISLLPEMVPGIVLILGIMLFWNDIYHLIPIYNTMYLLALAYIILFLPFTVQYVTSSFTQINPSLMSAGQVFGASPSYIFRRITLPLIKPGIITGWMMTFIISFRELVTASLISPPNKYVISTFIVREFGQGSVSTGMAMAVICVLLTTTTLLILNHVTRKKIV
ncbi:ABC transporter permease [Eremococcus coleocola]|uniref:ABC transporter permease n=1 Tax=Eremococcus coleocola TaxID=88132 RepID=UPI000485DE2D|nr:iron ABC transporter permease [Eremococcus coleocola]